MHKHLPCFWPFRKWICNDSRVSLCKQMLIFSSCIKRLHRTSSCWKAELALLYVILPTNWWSFRKYYVLRHGNKSDISVLFCLSFLSWYFVLRLMCSLVSKNQSDLAFSRLKQVFAESFFLFLPKIRQQCFLSDNAVLLFAELEILWQITHKRKFQTCQKYTFLIKNWMVCQSFGLSSF